MHSSTRLSIAVLAGGNSSRMGSNKALERLGGETMIAHIIAALRPLTDDLFIAGGEAADYEHLGTPHFPDRYDFRASMVGVYSAIAAARHDRCLVVSCDMPFVSPRLIETMAALANGHDAVVPAGESGLEPLCAVYSKSCLGVLQEAIESGRLTIREALTGLDVRPVQNVELESVCDPKMAFWNVNTPEDLRQAGEMQCAGNERTAGTLSRSGPPLICLVGKKNSGKTTFLEQLIPLLGKYGLDVAFIKHDVHGFSMDREGTDTWRLARAGAREIMISASGSFAHLGRVDGEMTLEEMYARVSAPVDLVLVEGFKRSRADKIEISRSSRSHELACREEDLVAVISDRSDAAVSVPVFGLEDFDGVARFLVSRYRLGPALGESEEAGEDAGDRSVGGRDE